MQPRGNANADRPAAVLLEARENEEGDEERRRTPLRLLGVLQIDGRGLALRAAFEIETELLAFVKATHSSPLDCRDVHDDVLRAIIRLNEAITLLCIEPFDGTHGHQEPP